VIVKTPKLDAAELRALDLIWQQHADLKPTLNQPARWQGTLRRQALAQAVRSSNSIEGFEANLSQVNEVMLGGALGEVKPATEQALQGYRQAMTFVLQIARDQPLTIDVNLLKSLHFMLQGYDLQMLPGRFRGGPIFVRDGKTNRVVHTGADWEQVPELIHELCASLVHSGEQVGLVSGAMAHLNLALIHPFKDGNGRTGRVLQSLVLAQSEPLSPLFLSIEEFLAAHTKEYYSVLAEVGGGVWNPKVNAKPWIRFVLNAHYRQAEQVRVNAAQLNASWNEVAHLVEALGMHERVVSPLVHVETGNRLTNQLYRTLVLEAGDSISTLTASRDLADLVEARLLVAVGDTRARSYVAGPALEQITLLLAGKFATRRLSKLF